VAKITAWGITNFQVTLEPQVANPAISQVSEAVTHTGKVQLIATQARPS
jgi:hypothetical protein